MGILLGTGAHANATAQMAPQARDVTNQKPGKRRCCYPTGHVQTDGPAKLRTMLTTETGVASDDLP